MAAIILLVIVDPAGAATGENDARLLRTYAPVFRVSVPTTPCSAGNGHLPLDVSDVVAAADVELVLPDGRRIAAPGAPRLARAPAGSKLDLPGAPRRNGCAERRWEADLVAAGARRAIYGRVVRDPDAPQALFAQYWYFLATNDWETVHEGDWEMVQLEFAAADPVTAGQTGPVRATYAQHAHAETLEWTEVDRTGGTHPDVWLAVGSNASEFGAGIFLRAPDGCDDTTGERTAVRYPVVVLDTDEAVAIEHEPWLRFEGRWGSRTGSAGPGPRGPALHPQWSAPWRWAHDRSRGSGRVPWRGAVAGWAADVLCVAVATGARTVRDARTLPAASRVGFGGGIALFALLLVIWSWRSVRSRSRAGVIGAIGLVVAALGLAGGVLQWIGEFLAVGSFAAVIDTVAVGAAVVVPLATIILLSGAAVVAATRTGSTAAMVATTLRHPIRSWRSSAEHTTAGMITGMLAWAALAAVVSRVLAISIILEQGFPFWTAMPIASVIDAILMGWVLGAIAARPTASRAPTPASP